MCFKCFEMQCLVCGDVLDNLSKYVICLGVFNAFDENRDNHIDFKEMACGISACCRGPLTERQKCKISISNVHV